MSFCCSSMGTNVGVGGWVSKISVSASGKRIQREMAELNLDPLPHCSVGPKGDNLYHWIATIIGPSGTTYESGIYFLDITYPSDYPFKTPKVIFESVDTTSNVSLPILKDGWCPAYKSSIRNQIDFHSP